MTLFNNKPTNSRINAITDNLITRLKELDSDNLVSQLNYIRYKLHEISPFKNEPVDYVKWVKNDEVTANDYNPNKVAPPEMELLELSIINDGYTQPIVTWNNEEKLAIEVIDGFHRNRVGKESKTVKARVNGYLPIVDIRKEQSDKNDRIASTIRHNRARGKHQIDAMSEIVIELKNRNWTNKRIAKQLGMDEEEVLRLCQISGLENLFSDNDFSKAWISSESDEKYIPITDDVTQNDMDKYKIPNELDTDRIYHTYDKWECYKAGFYENMHPSLSHDECENKYIELLSNQEEFSKVLEVLIDKWKFSCEHYLTNKFMNRIAWLGQAAVCYKFGIPSKYSYSWEKIPKPIQEEANKTAYKYLLKWLNRHQKDNPTIEEALVIGRQMELY